MFWLEGIQKEEVVEAEEQKEEEESMISLI